MSEHTLVIHPRAGDPSSKLEKLKVEILPYNTEACSEFQKLTGFVYPEGYGASLLDECKDRRIEILRRTESTVETAHVNMLWINPIYQNRCTVQFIGLSFKKVTL